MYKTFDRGGYILNYDEFTKYLKSDRITNNIFLLCGDELFLKNYGKTELLSKISPDSMPEFNIFSFDGKKYDLVSVKESIDALPVFTDSKLLLFNNSGIFQLTGKDAATKEYREFWEEIIDKIPPEVYIVFDEIKIDKRSALYKKLNKRNSVIEFDYLSEEKMISWTIGLFKTMGKIISPTDARYLIEITQDGMTSVKREAEKISAYTQGKTSVTRQDINDITVPVVENRVFDMVDALLSKKPHEALSMLNDLLILKEEETRILGAISSNADKLLTVKLMADDKMDKSIIASKTKIAPFIVSKYISLSSKYKSEDLKSLLSKCIEMDQLFKLTRCDKAVILQTFIAEFAS